MASGALLRRKLFCFKAKRQMNFFYPEMADRILQSMKRGDKTVSLSLDLNLSEKDCEIRGADLIVDEDTRVSRVDLEMVASQKNKVFSFDNGRMTPLEVRGNGYCKLVATSGAPTLEIDGIKMHRSKDIDPLHDAKLKTELVVRPGDVVLDTCGGLGYSAVFALKAGAAKVISFEKNKAVIQLRDINPWLKKYMDPRLEFRRGDSTEEIEGVENKSVNSIIHDPPRFTSSTGDLYGKAFYDHLFRVLAPRGRLFHYTGSPKRVKAQDRFVNNTINRLARSGFQKLMFHDDFQGIYGEKS